MPERRSRADTAKGSAAGISTETLKQYAPEILSAAVPMAGAMLVPGLREATLASAIGNILAGAGGYGAGLAFTDREKEQIQRELTEQVGVEAALSAIPVVGSAVRAGYRPAKEMILEILASRPDILEQFGGTAANIAASMRPIQEIAELGYEGDVPMPFFKGSPPGTEYWDVDDPRAWTPGLVGAQGSYWTESPMAARGYAQSMPDWDISTPEKKREIAGLLQELGSDPEALRSHFGRRIENVPDELRYEAGSFGHAREAGRASPMTQTLKQRFAEIADDLFYDVKNAADEFRLMGESGVDVGKLTDEEFRDLVSATSVFRGAVPAAQRLLDWGIEVSPELLHRTGTTGFLKAKVLNVKNPLDLDEVPSPKVVKDLLGKISEKIIKEFPEAADEPFDDMIELASREGLSGWQLMAKMRELSEQVSEKIFNNAVDAAVAKKGKSIKKQMADKGTSEAVATSNARVAAQKEIEAAMKADGSHPAIVGNVVRDAMLEAGYDGITHVGGANLGFAPHRVFVTLDPSQAKGLEKNTAYIEGVLSGAIYGSMGGVAAKAAQQVATRQGGQVESE